MSLAVKIAIVGPSGVGKSVIANLVSEYSDHIPADYKPTVGVRYERLWPAMQKDVDGVLFVLHPGTGSQDAEIERWYQAFGRPLKETQCQLFAHRPSGAKMTRPKLVAQMEKIPLSNTTMDAAESATILATEFGGFLNRVVEVAIQIRETQESAIMG